MPETAADDIRAREDLWPPIGIRLIDSAPPATTTSARPALTASAARAIDCRPDEQKRLLDRALHYGRPWQGGANVCAIIRRLGAKLGLTGLTPHRFRHTFAVTRMQRWYEQGLDVQALLPHLSVYLGHVHPQESYWYLTSVPELLGAAAKRFETFAQTGGRRHA